MSFSRKTFIDIFGELDSSFDVFTIEEISSTDKRSIISGPFGSNISSKFFKEEGIPVIRGNNLTEDSTMFIDDGFVYISKEKADELNTYAIENDLIFTAAGTIGQVGMIPKESKYDEYIISNKQLRVRLNLDEINPFYAYYWYSSEKINKYIKLLNTGSTIPLINLNILRSLPIPLPNKITQDKIANLILNIDKKISKNKQINHNLERIIHSLFIKYFSQNFPYHYYNDSFKGKWRIIKLKELVIRNNNKIKDFNDWKDELLIDLSNMPRFSIAITTFDTGEKFKSNIYKLDKFDLLFGSIRPYFGKVGFSPIDGVITGTIHSFKPIKNDYYSLILSLISSKDFINYTVSVSKGTKMPSVKWDDFIDYEFAIPEDPNYIKEYNNLVFPLIVKIDNNIQEIQKLTKIRDSFLPKLMSGEIDVSKVNCDLKLYFINSILKLTVQIWRHINMKTKIISKIQNQMKPYLNQGQYLKLTNSLLNSFKDVEILDNNNESNEIDNIKLLNSFLSAKQVEGRSEKTIVYYKSTLEKMLKAINKQVYNISTDDIRRYLFNYKEEKNSSKITLDNMRRIFSSFFSWLEDEDYILKNPVRRIHRVKTGRVVKEVLTDENLEILRDNCKEIRDLAIVEILISTGIRVGELVRLNIRDVNFYERECVVFGKGESERVVYFDARTKIHLLEYLESREDDNPALFVSLNKPYQRLGISGVETRLRELGKKCNIPKVHPHKFRRTLATNAIDKGMPIEQVQKLLGHVQIDTTMQYAMVNQSNVKIAHRKFIG